MKETKLYIGRRNGKHAELMQKLDKVLKEQHFAFVFTKQELKEHDRELVKEVCEKIKQDCWCGGAILEDDYYKVPVKYLQNLQKEIEK